MTRIATGSNDATETQPGGVQNNELEAPRELIEWWRTIMEIFMGISSPELKTKLWVFANREWEEKKKVREEKEQMRKEKEQMRKEKEQYARVLHEKNKIEYEALIESAMLKQEIEKHKDAFAAAQHQIAGLQQQICEGGVGVRSRDDVNGTTSTSTSVLRKRRRIDYNPEEDEDEYNPEEDKDKDDPPRKRRIRTKCPGEFSYEQIKDILGGKDRGWGTSDSRCRFGDEYTYHALLNVEEHFFGQSPTREQDVAKAVFGFGKTDNNIISEAIEFPLFVCYEPGKRSKHFRYLGNYVALKLDPVAREWMSEGVPCSRDRACRLEFRVFDEGLNAKIQRSAGRDRNK